MKRLTVWALVAIMAMGLTAFASPPTNEQNAQDAGNQVTLEGLTAGAQYNKIAAAATVDTSPAQASPATISPHQNGNSITKAMSGTTTESVPINAPAQATPNNITDDQCSTRTPDTAAARFAQVQGVVNHQLAIAYALADGQSITVWHAVPFNVAAWDHAVDQAAPFDPQLTKITVLTNDWTGDNHRTVALDAPAATIARNESINFSHVQAAQVWTHTASVLGGGRAPATIAAGAALAKATPDSTIAPSPPTFAVLLC